jgi:hypothetical protein
LDYQEVLKAKLRHTNCMKTTRTFAAKVAACLCSLAALWPALATAQGGVPLWTNMHPSGTASAIAVDNRGNVFVTGTDFSDYVTVAYSNSGVPIWTNRYDGPANSGDLASAIAVGSDGNVFVTGASYDASGDYATIKYSNAGVPLWTNRYDGPGNWADQAAAIAVDSHGDVLVTGRSANGSFNSNLGLDYATIKYSSMGVPLWTRRYAGPGNRIDFPHAIAVDSIGNVFVTTESYNSTISESVTLAYSSSGVPLWTNRFNGGLYKMAVDRSGNVFVTGNGTNNDFVTIKYSSSIPPPRPDFQKLNNELVLNWTNAGFSLQTAPAVTGPFTNVPAATSPYTNDTSGSQQFFRLISN